ncbi:MAG: hypothetical protein RLZZ117_2166 [Cyanobacteriota bacterium]|jgi:phospholipase/lecithinase/hemolysin
MFDFAAKLHCLGGLGPRSLGLRQDAGTGNTRRANTPQQHQANWRGRLTSLALLACLGVSVGQQAASAKVTQLETLYVFGDSYSDAGNSGLLTLGIPPFNNGFPPTPYADGRVSNGPVAVEQLWSLYNPAAPPLQPSLSGGTNYAVNGATTGLESQFAVDTTPEFAPIRPAFANTSAYSQLQTFLSPPKSFQPDKTLFVVWMGGNDGLYWLKTQTAPGIGSTPGTIDGDPPSAGKNVFQLLDNAVANIETGIQTLINRGASNILVPNLLNLSLAPAYNTDPGQAILIQQLVVGFNTRLAARLSALQAANPHIDLMPFDTFGLFDQIRSQPAAYGLTNVSQRCVVDLTPDPACDPNQWFFWDGLHPTTKGHSLIAEAMFQQVPGPLPLTGAAAALGWSRRLRRRIQGTPHAAPCKRRVPMA